MLMFSKKPKTQNMPTTQKNPASDAYVRPRPSMPPFQAALAVFAYFVLTVSASSILFSHSSVSARDTAPSRDFLDGLAYYRTNEFHKSAEAFERVAAAGVANGKLFYNLGNAYLKSGELGRAVLWYERAHRLIPDDPDLKFNLDYARSLTKDAREEKRSALTKVFFFWRESFGPTTVKYLAIFSNLVFWALLALKKIEAISWRRAATLKVLRYLFFVAAIVFTLTALHGRYMDKHYRSGVILAEKVSVRSGLAEDSTELFVLHAGTKVTIEKEIENHYRIHFSEDKIGWLKKSEAAVI